MQLQSIIPCEGYKYGKVKFLDHFYFAATRSTYPNLKDATIQALQSVAGSGVIFKYPTGSAKKFGIVWFDEYGTGFTIPLSWKE